MTKATRATENNNFKSLCQLILEQCQTINTKIEDQSKQTNNKIDSNHETLIQLLSKADAKAQEVLEKAESNEFDIKNIKDELNTTKDSLDDKQHQIKTLQNDLNDQIDSNMQSTILVRGLPQKQNGKSWNDTALAFANHLTEKLQWDENSRNMVLNDIERVHRGKKKEDDDVPLVYIKFHLWKTAQSILKEIHGNEKKKLTVSVQQM